MRICIESRATRPQGKEGKDMQIATSITEDSKRCSIATM